MLIANNILSTVLIIVCWWLAHQNAAGREPFGRSIATGYALLAMDVLANMLFRSFEEMQHLLPYSLLFGKVILTATLWLVAIRLSQLNAARPTP